MRRGPRGSASRGLQRGVRGSDDRASWPRDCAIWARGRAEQTCSTWQPRPRPRPGLCPRRLTSAGRCSALPPGGRGQGTGSPPLPHPGRGRWDTTRFPGVRPVRPVPAASGGLLPGRPVRWEGWDRGESWKILTLLFHQ